MRTVLLEEAAAVLEGGAAAGDRSELGIVVVGVRGSPGGRKCGGRSVGTRDRGRLGVKPE